MEGSRKWLFTLCGLGCMVIIVVTISLCWNQILSQFYIFRLSAAEQATQDQAGQMLVKLGSSRAIPVLLALESQRLGGSYRGGEGGKPWPMPLHDAAERICKQDGKSCFRYLQESINGDDWLARDMALRLLPVTGEPHLDILRHSLKDSRNQIRMSSAYVLGKLGSQAIPAISDIVEVLRSDPESGVKESAASALGEIGLGTAPVIQALEAGMTSKHPGVEYACSQALKKIKGVQGALQR